MEEPIMEFLKKTLKLKNGGSEEVAGNYAKFGFLLNPFAQFESPLSTDFNDLFVGRREELEKISKNLIKSVIGTGADIALVGPTGVGARTIVSVLKHFLRTEKKESRENSIISKKLHRIIERDLSEFSPEVREEVKEEIREGFEEGKMTIIATAFSDLRLPLLGRNAFGENTLETIRKIIYIDMDYLDRVSYINPWAANTWYWVTREESAAIKDYEYMYIIDPLDEKEIIELLRRRIEFFKVKKEGITEIFTSDILKEIAKFSGGFPRFAIKAACFLLDHCAEKNCKLNKEDISKILKEYGIISYDEIKKKFNEVIPSCCALTELEKINNPKLEKLNKYLTLKDNDDFFKKDPELSMKIKRLKYELQIPKDMIKLVGNDEKLFYEVKYRILNLRKVKKKGDIYKKVIQIFLGLNGHNVTATSIHNYFREVSKQTISKKMAEMLEKGLLKGGDNTVKKDNRTKIYSIDDFTRCVFENEYLMPQIRS